MESSGIEAGNTASPLSPESLRSSESVAEWEGSQETVSTDHRRPSRIKKGRAPKRPTPSLACINCRTKKVKCQLEDGGCMRCVKLQLECSVPVDDERRQPSSKKLIRGLQAEILSLKNALSEAQTSSRNEIGGECPMPSPSTSSRSQDRMSMPPSLPEQSNTPRSMLARLCGGQWQLNRDASGQLRCFGPTSSLHVTESVSSSLLCWDNIDETRSVSQWQTLIPADLQRDLLDLYWKYQHPVLQVVHKEAFLNGMACRQTPYFSELLLCCVFACAARMSDRPEVRALVFLADDSESDDVPFLAATVTSLLEVELQRPGITTVQSLLLLSVMDCARSNDTKGWLYAGDACRLAFDIGLHRDFQYLGSALLSPLDLEIRQKVFWACFVFDRLWGLYLGRPHCIRLCDATVPRLRFNDPDVDFDHQMAAAWASLLEIVGRISEILNGDDWVPDQFTKLDAELGNWLAGLPRSLQYQSAAPPAVFVLHMQYCSAVILIHRSTANFGTAGANSVATASCEAARDACVAKACQLAHIVQDYQNHHGSVLTMSGVALHTIAMAATTLVANIVESSGSGTSGSPIRNQILSLKQCMRALSQLETSYCVTRRVRKLIQLVIRLLNLNLDQELALSYVLPPSIPQGTQPEIGMLQQTALSHDPCTSNDLGNARMESWNCPELTSPFMVEDFLFSTTAQSDFLLFI